MRVGGRKQNQSIFGAKHLIMFYLFSWKCFYERRHKSIINSSRAISKLVGLIRPGPFGVCGWWRGVIWFIYLSFIYNCYLFSIFLFWLNSHSFLPPFVLTFGKSKSRDPLSRYDWIWENHAHLWSLNTFFGWLFKIRIQNIKFHNLTIDLFLSSKGNFHLQKVFAMCSSSS